jgi:hypothetical protein
VHLIYEDREKHKLRVFESEGDEKNIWTQEKGNNRKDVIDGACSKHGVEKCTKKIGNPEQKTQDT